MTFLRFFFSVYSAVKKINHREHRETAEENVLHPLQNKNIYAWSFVGDANFASPTLMWE